MQDISPVGQGAVGSLARSNGTANQVNGRAAGHVEPKQIPADRVELSEHARYLNRLRELPDIRTSKVADIRQQIAEGTYPSAEKLELAIERVLDEINDE